MYRVYLLSHPKGVTYIGITTDIERRVQQHNKQITGGAKYTKSFTPEWKLELLSKEMSKSDALKLEYSTKKHKGLLLRRKALSSVCE